MKGFKSFLREGSTSGSTKMEGVIIFCYNTYLENSSFEYFQSKLKKDKFIKDFIKSPGKINLGKEPTKTLHEFGKKLVKEVGRVGIGDAGIGQSSPKTSTFWNNITGKGVDVSKTDIGIGKNKVSVKNEKAQLMSGKSKESKATFLTAIEMSGSTKNKLIKQTIGYIDDFVSDIKTEGTNMDTTTLKKLKSTELKSKVNKLAKKQIERADEVKSLALDNLQKIFNKNDELKKAFVFEAATGVEKFGGKIFKQGSGDTIGVADSFLVFKNDLNNVIFHTIKSPNSRLIKKISDSIELNVGMKSTSIKKVIDGKKQKVGYDIFQTVRLATKTTFNESISLIEKVEKYENMLNEGVRNKEEINEKISDILYKIKNKWDSFVDYIKNTFNKIKTWIKENVVNVLEFFGIDVDVNDTLINKEVQLI